MKAMDFVWIGLIAYAVAAALQAGYVPNVLPQRT
jgi:hypothetical protein